MHKAFKYRLYPNKVQKEYLDKTIKNVKLLYNLMLSDKISYYQETGKCLYKTPSQYKADYPELKEVDSIALNYASMHLRTAYQNFFSQSHKFPKYKSLNSITGSFTTSVRIENGHLIIPKIRKMPIKMRLHRELPPNCNLRSVTISRTATRKYFASVLVEMEDVSVPKQEVEYEKTLGIQFSPETLFVGSDGTTGKHPLFYQREMNRLKTEQSKLSHIKSETDLKEEQQMVVAGLHEKIVNQRRDFLHKLSTEIADNYDCVCVGKIKITDFMQKCGNQNQYITDNGWNLFTSFLKYKMEERGKPYIEVQPNDLEGDNVNSVNAQTIKDIGFKKISA